MKFIRPTHVLLAALVATFTLSLSNGLDAQPMPAPAQPVAPAPAAPTPRPRTSPHDTISARIDGNRVTIVYGRPYSKDPKTGEIRKIWGMLVPAGKPWRTGSDEATLLITQQPLDLGGTALPAGAYTLYTLLADDGSAQLLINKKLGQWGADPYDATQEFAKVALTKEPLMAQLDQFMMTIERNPAGGGLIKLMWENTQFSVPFTIKK